ncbi:hypothetical protein [Georgenia yuyongxinii]|uniref:hypothetical protein n=1 Tax=Georgenia yuyongxinii TaxID=2589797 RepID=UPI001C8F7146|nr:hypothetical protein [Georgenia yuyongxinii]
MPVALLLAACTTVGQDDGATSTPPSPEPAVSALTVPAETAVLAVDDAAGLAHESSRAFFTSAPVVVLASEVEVLQGASAASALGVPVLVDGDDAVVRGELERLDPEAVLMVGDADLPDGVPDVAVVEAPRDAEALGELLEVTWGAAEPVAAGAEVAAVASLDPAAPVLLEPAEPAPGTEAARDDEEPPSADATAEAAELPLSAPPEPAAGAVVVMTTGEPQQAAAVANAGVAGARVQVVPTGDPRATAESVQETAANAPEVVLALGTAFGDAGTLGWRVATAATGTELPGGGQLALPGKTYIALYGHPGSSALGVLGEQDAAATTERARAHAEPFRALTDTQVVPALEIIATVASAGPGDDGNYSAEATVEQLRPLVDLAHEQGQYVVLDLQPGRTDFLTQAKRYEELLKLPNVGLALDPEWRLKPDQVHLRQIGQVDVAEVDQVVTWLADLVRANSLPQKVLILHQFQVRMIPGVDEVDQSRSELAIVVHADGQGSQPAKQTTWSTLHANAPSIRWWGWKNFYDEDSPMLTPEQTMQVQPAPAFVSYQ